MAMVDIRTMCRRRRGHPAGGEAGKTGEEPLMTTSLRLRSGLRAYL
jgi:hypothetical protein